MSKQTQLNFVKNRLDERGYITRNECLRNRISRLSAIIYNLKEMGCKISGRRIPYSDDRWDYKYEVED